jgi:ATP-dependent Clp protease adaptor protein ClpS
MSLPTPETEVVSTTQYLVASDDELARPYRVIIENDDVTPMDFVTLVLCAIFGLTIERAVDVMLTAHTSGRALVAVYPYEEARDRVYRAHDAAREAGYPLSFYLEPDA